MKTWTMRRWFFALMGGLLVASPAAAQRGGSALQNRFEKNSPGIGQTLPDITLYDEQGRPFAVRDLKGHYSVIVFGCLT